MKMITFFSAQQLRKVRKNQSLFKPNPEISGLINPKGLTQNNRTQIRIWVVLAYMLVYINLIILKPLIEKKVKKEIKVLIYKK